ncbi:expressed conserved protein [Echinococcus multilocularis]|uniref:Expressed conserved protein n=1 Tax=Echinococcus multilocularis TaxID=6211 RepID=A0A068YFX5_ECHMU|nr:expressed conserved protein [Echinococcus multilocularis]
MYKRSLLHLPTNQNERLYKFTILTPHTFLPPNHSESLEDELAEDFAQFLCDRVSTVLGARSYTPHHDGEAFLNMRFNEFEERFLRHSDYTIFITSGRNAACLDLIYPRMLVFLTTRPTWRDRGIVLYVGPPVGQKLFDPDLFANEPLIFPLNKEEWSSLGNPWNKLVGTLQTKVPLTPESKRLKPLTQRPLSKMANAEANEKWKGTESMHLNQSEAKVKGPIKSKVCGTQLSRNAAESIQSSEEGFFTPPFTLSPSLIPFRFSFRQKEHNLRDHLSSSLNEMCLFGNLLRCHKKNSHARKVKQRQYSDSAVSEEQKHENIDDICFPRRYKTKKKKLLMTEPILNKRTEQIIVKTPEVIRVSILEISNPLQPRKTLQAHCLQVKDGDDSLDKRSSPNSTLSSSPSKRKTNTLGKCRKSKIRCDSGIASNFSFISTEISSSSPSLCNHQHSIPLAKSPSTFFSCSSPSCLDSLEIGQNPSCMQECSPEASSLHSTHSRSSTGEQHIALVEDSIKFVDDEVSDNELIHSERRRIDKRERFVKPGMPPLKNPNPHETVTKLSQSYRPQIMNPDSKASSDSIEDPTFTEGYDVECPEDYHLHSDISFSQSCKEQVIQGSEKSQDILNKETTHVDKRNSQKNYQKSLMESTNLYKVRKSEQKNSRDTILSRTNQFDEQIPQEQFPEKLTESMDPMVNVNTFESENFRLIEKNLREEFSQNQGIFVNQFDSIQRVPNNSETEVAQKNMEALIHKALISPIKADAFESLPVSSGLQILANETNTISKQTHFVDKYLHQPEIINDQLQKQSESVTESTQPSIILLEDLNSAVRIEGDTDHPFGLDKESSLQRNNMGNDSNNQASTTDEKNSEIQLSVDSGLGDSIKIVEASMYSQNDLVLTVGAESVESSILSEESIALPMNRYLDNVANLPLLHYKANSRCQEGLFHDWCIQTHQNESTTTKETYFLEYKPTISPNEDRAVLCQQPLPVNESVGHVMPEHFEKVVDQSDAKQGILIQQKLLNFESSAPEKLILSEEPDSSKNNRLESDGKSTDVSEEESCTKLERRSILLDQNCSVDVFNRETCEIIRGMLKDPTPKTLWLARCAIETYDQYPSHADPIFPTTASALEIKSPAAVVKRSTYFQRMFPYISVAILNLSTAYIPRYLTTIYEYSMASLNTEHPDIRLRKLTSTIQGAFLNHPLGVPFLLAGTTLLSPWLVRQFPLTLLAICGAAPDTLCRLFAQPGAFLSEHFADLSEVFHVAPTWTIFAAIGGRGVHWRLVRPP